MNDARMRVELSIELHDGDGAGRLGREVSLTAAEVSGTVDLLEQVLSKLYQSVFTL